MINEIKMFTRLILFTVIVGGTQACTTTNSQNNTEGLKTEDNTNISKLETREIKSTVLKQNAFAWNIKTTQISKNSQIDKIYFYNENIGFGIAFNKVFKTIDGGISWEKFDSSATFGLNDIFLTSLTEKFAVGYKLGKESDLILKKDDNRQKWKIIYSSELISLNRILFSSDGLGWAIGGRNVITPKRDSVNLVLFSNDHGKTWKDVSEQINQLAKNERGWIGDYLTDIMFSENEGVFLLSLRGKIYNTFDQGKSWKLVSELVDEPDQTGIRHFGRLEDGRFWIAGGTISQEGHWGMVAVMNNSLGWDRYRLIGYYFADVEFLSNNEVIASGSLVAPSNFGGANELNKGVILYSSDSGKNWSIVHESQTTSEFTSIAKLSEQKILVAGKNGELVFLGRSSKIDGN